jgi:hypothetical protein
MNDELLKKLLAGNIYDYSETPEQNELNGAGMLGVNKLPTDTRKQTNYGNYGNITLPNSPMPLANDPNNEIPVSEEMNLRKVVPLDFTNEPPERVVPTPMPSQVRPNLPFTNRESDALSKVQSLPDDGELSLDDNNTSAQEVAKKSPASLQDILAGLKKPADMSELKDAQSERNNTIRNLLMMKGANTIAQAFVHQKPDENFLNDHISLAEKNVSDIKERQKAAQDAEELGFKRSKSYLDEKKSVLDFDDDTKRRDVNSAESLEAVRMVNRLAQENGMKPLYKEGEISFARIKELQPIMGQSIEAKARKDAASLARENINAQKEISRNDTNNRFQERMSEKKEQEAKDDLIKLSTKLGNPQALAISLSLVDDALGFKLDSADISKNGDIKVGGKKVDLPGVSIPLIGRTSFYESDARVLSGRIGRVFNTELKDRSGAAVTTNEMERLRNEFGSGKFNTEAEMLGALKDYKKAVAAALKDIEGGFDPKIVNKYTEQGGTTSKVFAPTVSQGASASTFPRTVRKGNQEATVKDASELAEANKEGFN